MDRPVRKSALWLDWSAEQVSDVYKSLGVPETRGAALVNDAPVLALLAEDVPSTGTALDPTLSPLLPDTLAAGSCRHLVLHILDCARDGLRYMLGETWSRGRSSFHARC